MAWMTWLKLCCGRTTISHDFRSCTRILLSRGGGTWHVVFLHTHCMVCTEPSYFSDMLRIYWVSTWGPAVSHRGLHGVLHTRSYAHCRTYAALRTQRVSHSDPNHLHTFAPSSLIRRTRKPTYSRHAKVHAPYIPHHLRSFPPADGFQPSQLWEQSVTPR